MWKVGGRETKSGVYECACPCVCLHGGGRAGDGDSGGLDGLATGSFIQ